MKKLELLMANWCMNPYDLCEKAKMSYQTYTRIRAGEKVKFATVGKIARALGVKVEQIIKED